MSQSALTAKYRPQRFADVAGQETIKGILSRAAREDRIAPAYLFSGTRGVGKTTIARILAKAVNCLEAPTAEPCNKCVHCMQITQGVAVDVIEIDGASNRGIDDARRIREDIGYAPMQCRYKVFIIDEAHMLTKEASNALLKTLEEPPGNVTFILATTEPHKILPTIVSRCQHYSFKRLTQPDLAAHLENVLRQENAAYDPRALQLIARRASGSVRDSMSLLGQALALGRERLEVDDVRSILGLAGSEVFFNVLQAVAGQDPLAINATLRELLDQGLDLGFFLRELAQTWRNLFLLKQTGDKALPLLELPPEEGAAWLQWAEKFSLAHIHAAWQMTLEGQRRVLTSLEPALALELLLLNLAYLPSLVSLENVAAPPRTGGAGSAPGGGQSPQSGGGASPGRPLPGRRASGAQRTAAPLKTSSAPQPAPQAAERDMSDPPPWDEEAPHPACDEQPGEPEQAVSPQDLDEERTPPGRRSAPAPETPAAMPAPVPAPSSVPSSAKEEPAARQAAVAPPAAGRRSWEGFLEFAAQAGEQDGHSMGYLRQIGGMYDGGRLQLRCLSSMQRCKITEGEYGVWVERLVRAYFGDDVLMDVSEPDNRVPDRQQSKEELEQHPLVQTLQHEFGARIVNWNAVETTRQ